MLEMPTAVKQHVIHFEVDSEPLETTDPILTVGQILDLAGLSRADHYLIEIRGHNQVKHTDLNEELRLHEHEKFVSVFTGPTPVS
jgi:hypothetical protein